jgi:adenylate cyclase
VNTAHRLQGLTRTLQTPLVVADAVIAQLDGGRTDEVERLLGHLRDQGEQVLRGRSTPIRVWTKVE